MCKPQCELPACTEKSAMLGLRGLKSWRTLEALNRMMKSQRAKCVGGQVGGGQAVKEYLMGKYATFPRS